MIFINIYIILLKLITYYHNTEFNLHYPTVLNLSLIKKIIQNSLLQYISVFIIELLKIYYKYNAIYLYSLLFQF